MKGDNNLNGNSFILFPASDISTSALWLQILLTFSIDLWEFEVRKEYIYEHKFKVKLLVIYTISSKRELLDQTLKKLKIGNGTRGRYISFKLMDQENRIEALYLSNVYNKDRKFEILYGIVPNKMVQFNGEEKEIRDILLQVK